MNSSASSPPIFLSHHFTIIYLLSTFTATLNLDSIGQRRYINPPIVILTQGILTTHAIARYVRKSLMRRA